MGENNEIGMPLVNIFHSHYCSVSFALWPYFSLKFINSSTECRFDFTHARFIEERWDISSEPNPLLDIRHFVNSGQHCGFHLPK